MAVQNKTIGSIGGDTYKHFRKSMVPFVTPKVQTADISPHCLERKILYGILKNTQRRCYTAFSKSKPYKNAETQTDYRESEAQTEPWEPPCKIVPGNNYIAVILYQIHRIYKSINKAEETKHEEEAKLEMPKREFYYILIFI